MISWATITYGAVLSAVVAALAVWLLIKPRRVSVAAAAAASAIIGPVAWNSILQATDASSFFVDAPFRLMPASWQDTGSGVFTVAVAATLIGLGPYARQPSNRLVLVALLTGLAAFLVDVYLY